MQLLDSFIDFFWSAGSYIPSCCPLVVPMFLLPLSLQVYKSIAFLFVLYLVLQSSSMLQRPNYAWSPSPPLPFLL